jgi:hypothetical protein
VKESPTTEVDGADLLTKRSADFPFGPLSAFGPADEAAVVLGLLDDVAGLEPGVEPWVVWFSGDDAGSVVGVGVGV